IPADFLYEAALYPEAEYTFKHPLTQEVAYHSQLGDRRARLHGSVARALQALHAEKLDERAALIANHLEAAADALDAAQCHARAAQWAGAHDREAGFAALAARKEAPCPDDRFARDDRAGAGFSYADTKPVLDPGRLRRRGRDRLQQGKDPGKSCGRPPHARIA